MYNKQSPYILTVKESEEVYICQCGKTAKAPLCDGSHKQVDGIKPLVHTANGDGELYVCGCGKSANMPWCDGSHNN